MLAFASAHAALQLRDRGGAGLRGAPGTRPPRPFRIRIGAHTGFVIADADDFYGRNVVLAARIADRAGGGEILVSEAAKQYTESDPSFRFEHPRRPAPQGPGGRALGVRAAWEWRGRGLEPGRRAQISSRLVSSRP